MDYLLIDPFNQGTSGVSTYCRLAKGRLIALGLRAEIIARAANESLEEFRHRLPGSLDPFLSDDTIVEAPETLAVTRGLRHPKRIHIRLHGSRHFGAWLQNTPTNTSEKAEEQRELERAWHVSAPSHAAVVTHRFHFGTDISAQVYPNPTPPFAATPATTQRDTDFLFLGRWQPLKGTHFYLELARRLPNFRFAAACAEGVGGLAPNLRQWSAHTPDQKNEALRRTSVVVIPSLFETASMVGLEAMAAARTIVTWSHLGLAEYAEAPNLLTATPWDLDDLAAKARSALDGPFNCGDPNMLQRINSAFDDAVGSLIKGSPPPKDWSPSPRPIDYRKIFAAMPASQHTAQKHVFQRKFRKLLRDPAAYWRDSVVRRSILQMKEPPPSSNLPPAQAIGQPEQTTPPSMQEGPKRPSSVLGNIGPADLIKLKAPPKGISGWRVAIAHSTEDTALIDELILSLKEFKDFSPTQPEKISLLTFTHSPSEPVPALINRIDQKNKELIGQLDHILLVNSPANLAVALKHCAPLHRTLSVVTNGELPYATADATSADSLIAIDGHPISQSTGWRRKAIVPNLEKLPLAILRVIRETGPKTVDMLIQLKGDPVHDPYLHDFNPSRFQGIIRLNSRVLPRADSMRDFIKGISRDISDLYVLESIYTRYRSLCAEVEDGGDPAALIEYCLKDGVLFDVS